MSKPTAFNRIRLELARSKEFPNGSQRHGYEFVAPLDRNAHIDAARWNEDRERCRVHRFWGDEDDVGQLVHKPGGSEHARWVFDYDVEKTDDDETGYRFGAHSFREGEYVSISATNDISHTFRVVSVSPAN